MKVDRLRLVRDYHERSKHHPQRYAAALGYMDWASQPNPFRTYAGTVQLPLEHPPLLDEPTNDRLYAAVDLPIAPLDSTALGRLFYDSLALSAWKQAPRTRPWSLRINPSSGALQPTECYLVAGPVPGLSAEPGVYHYAPYHHALERRRTLSRSAWDKLTEGLPRPCVLAALTSIYWRESWKYGERAFRYCHHDVGHAIGTLALAARTLGWHARLIDSATTDELARLLGVDTQSGTEAEHADCVLALYPAAATLPAAGAAGRLGAVAAGFEGEPNRLSEQHHDWPIIDAVGEATRHDGRGALPDFTVAPLPPERDGERGLSAQRIIRQRRSAVDMDGRTSLPRAAFFRMLRRVLPDRCAIPFATLPWPPCASLLLFVHRVEEVQPGLYVLVRHPGHAASLCAELRDDAAWNKPDGCPDDLPLHLLVAGDARRVAKLVSCDQDIAADGAFAAAMVCQYGARLEQDGPSAYPRMFWETGLIGQVLYLEAEAAGLRATGIGCFFDDLTHDYAGLTGHAWQDLYHFTVGGPVDDPRIKNIAPYAHLRLAERHA